MTQSGDAHQWDYAILGAGALGSILGVQLHQAGHRVAMIARGPRAATVRNQGLRLTGLVDAAAPVAVIDDPRLIESARVLIVATKAIGTLEALDRLRHLRVETVLSLQNGVRKDADLATIFGAARQLGAVADFSGELMPGGEVAFTRNEGLYLGEADGLASARLDRIVGELAGAGITTVAVDDIRTRAWSKFVGWAGLFAASVLVRERTWKYLQDRDAALAIARIVREMAALAAAQGVALNDRAILPVATLSRSDAAAAIAIIHEVGERFRSQAPDHKVSAVQDAEAGRPLELEETIGFALETAAATSIAMPTLTAIYPFLSAVNRINTA